MRLAILTNVLSDQLDRFTDPEIVAEKLHQIASSAEILVLNSDDKNLCQFAVDHPNVVGFGLAPGSHGEWVLPQYALNFGQHPEISRSVEVVSGENLAISTGSRLFNTKQQSLALALNLAAAYCAANALSNLDADAVSGVLGSEVGVFARNEQTEINGRSVNLRLVQNPTSFQLNLSELSGSEQPLMLMAGRDIHDPSWLWTVDFSGLSKIDIVGGFNAAELALRLKVSGCEVGEVIPEIAAASDRFFSLSGNKPTILFSADAMRRFRRYTKVAK